MSGLASGQAAADPAVPGPAGGPAWWEGRFFPNACDDRISTFEMDVGAEVVAGRHLPVAANLRAVSEHLGPRADALMRDWRALWDAAIPDVEGHAAYLGIEEAADREGWRPYEERRARERLDAGEAAAAAGFLREIHRDHAPRVRERALHVAEDAALQLALARSGLPVVLRLRAMGEPPLQRLYGKTAAERGLRPLPRGVVAGLPSVDWTERDDNPYWRLRAFRDRAGRGMALAADYDQLVLILADMARQGRELAFLKATEVKCGTWVVRTDPDPAAVERRLAEALGPALVRLGSGRGRTRAVLVQDLVPFRREHRFFVVGDRVAAATPSARPLSVLDADPRRLGAGVAALAHPASGPGPYDRGLTGLVPDRPLLARMALGVRDLARALAAERPPDDAMPGAARWRLPDCYVVDMGETLDGRVLPIEINGLRHAGLYALDAGRLAASLELRRARAAIRGNAVAAGAGARVPGESSAVVTPLSVGPERSAAGLTRVREHLTVEMVFSGMTAPDPAYGPPLRGEAAVGLLVDSAELVIVHAPLDRHPRDAMANWGPETLPGPWTLEPPPTPYALRGLVSGRELGRYVLRAGTPLPGMPRVTLSDAIGPGGDRVGIGPYAGFHAHAFRPGEGHRGDALPPIVPREPDLLVLPLGAGRKALARDLAARIPPAALERLRAAFGLERWPSVEAALREGEPRLALCDLVDRLSRAPGAPGAGAGWTAWLRAEAGEEGVRAWRELAKVLGGARHGTATLSLEMPVGPGDEALGEALRAHPLGRRWRYRHERRREDEHDGLLPCAPPPRGTRIVELEARVAVDAIDRGASVAEGVAWRADVDGVVLRPGAAVVLRGAFEAGSCDPAGGLEGLRRRLVAVDRPVPPGSFA